MCIRDRFQSAPGCKQKGQIRQLFLCLDHLCLAAQKREIKHYCADREPCNPVSYTHLDVYKRQVRNCMASGLVKGEGFAVDASLIAANASHQHSVQVGEHCDWNRPEIDTRAMREYLAALDDEALAEVVPRKVSLSDPHSRWTAATGGIAFFAYSTNYPVSYTHLDVYKRQILMKAHISGTAACS